MLKKTPNIEALRYPAASPFRRRACPISSSARWSHCMFEFIGPCALNVPFEKERVGMRVGGRVRMGTPPVLASPAASLAAFLNILMDKIKLQRFSLGWLVS